MSGNNPRSSKPLTSLFTMFIERAEAAPEAVALLAPGRSSSSYAQTRQAVETIVRQLNERGLSRRDRIGIILPDGPETVVTLLAVMTAAVSAPLNPRFTEEEYAFYLKDLGLRAIILPAGADSPARAAAARLGLAVLELAAESDKPAGTCALTGESLGTAAPRVPPQPEDLAVVMHTAGTTARPKIVCLTHANFCASARNVCSALGLTSQDRCLCVMPLFHISGMSTWLYAFASGGSAVCARAFLAGEFFGWMDEFRPSWYNVAPALHQSILRRAPQHLEVISRCPLRFLRSSAAAMPPSLIAALENTFGVPLIEAYGMTEGASQMASNPMPPAKRKPGSVGLGFGTQIAVIDEAGIALPQGQVGEVMIRGDNVFAGYENNPSANRECFLNGWFRTGDCGYLDQDGYLFLTGRIKELINRGGEKISVYEIDDALLRHPGVAEAAAFSMPDGRLGEAVAAAVVLKPHAAATEMQLREFVGEFLAAYKVPDRIVFVQELPKSSSNKIRRLGLAERLGLAGRPATAKASAIYVAPRNPLESRLAEIWTRVLKLPQVGIRDDFLQLGGDSIQAYLVLARIREMLFVEVPFIRLFAASTIEDQARLVTELQAQSDPEGEIARLLADLEALPDDQAAELASQLSLVSDTHA